jgi:hypothetical protein
MQLIRIKIQLVLSVVSKLFTPLWYVCLVYIKLKQNHFNDAWIKILIFIITHWLVRNIYVVTYAFM